MFTTNLSTYTFFINSSATLHTLRNFNINKYGHSPKGFGLPHTVNIKISNTISVTFVIYSKCIKTSVNAVKEACFIKLEFLWEGWLIQNLKCCFRYRCLGGVPQVICKNMVKLNYKYFTKKKTSN